MKAMKNWINRLNIALTMAAESELETIAAMLELARQRSTVRNVQALASNIMRQEILSPSASGYCAIVFRAIHSSVAKPALFFGRFDKGIGYYSQQGHPIDLIFLLVAPPEMENEFDSMIRKIEQAIVKAPFREQLRGAQNPEQVVELLVEVLT